MIVLEYTGNSIFPVTLKEFEALPGLFYYLNLEDQQTQETHTLQLTITTDNERGQICSVSEIQKSDLRAGRYSYVINSDIIETTTPQGEIIERGFLLFKDDRVINEIYK